MITTKVHPWDQRGPNMMVGFDHDGNQVAIEFIDDESEMRDAVRYRWLKANAKEIVFRSGHGVTCFGSFDDKAEELDAAVDAAMTADVAGSQITATEVTQRIKEFPA